MVAPRSTLVWKWLGRLSDSMRRHGYSMATSNLPEKHGEMINQDYRGRESPFMQRYPDAHEQVKPSGLSVVGEHTPPEPAAKQLCVPV